MRTQYSAPPTHCADSLAHRQSENPMAQTANALRLRMLNRSRQRPNVPKASNAAEHTKHICSRPHPSNGWASVFLPLGVPVLSSPPPCCQF